MSKRKGHRYLRKIVVHIPGMLAILFLFIVLGLISRVKAGGPWYVSPAGNDDNDCLSWETACQTIGSAVDRADAGDTIFLSTGVFTRGATIDKNLILQGVEADSTIVNANASSRVFTITSGCVVTMTSIAISGGNSAEGGGIYSEGTLALNACAIYSNTAAGSDGAPAQNGGDGIGGGIYSTGTLILNSCDIYSNSAVGGDGGDSDGGLWVGNGGSASGGGVYSTGSLTLNGCVIRNNEAIGGDSGLNERGEYEGRGGGSAGSGIYTEGMLRVKDSILDGNIATGGIGIYGGGSAGGGIYGGGTLIVDNATIINNIGGGMYTNPYISGYSIVEVSNSIVSDNTGIGIRDTCANTLDCTLILKNSTVSGNQGGGIFTSGASAGSTSVVSITGSTISGNTAYFQGGGIVSDNQIGGNKTLVLANSTISGNDGGDAGGGIRVSTTSQSTNVVKIINTSIVSNTADSGCGIYADAGGSGSSLVTLENSIVANDSPNKNCLTGWGGEIVSYGHNLDSGNSCGFIAPGDITNTHPHLGPLQNNGGQTYTHALLPDSLAIDAGNPSTCMVAPINGIDQRGFPRDTACDIGAYEIPEYIAFLPVLLQEWPERHLEVAIVVNDTR